MSVLLTLMLAASSVGDGNSELFAKNRWAPVTYLAFTDIARCIVGRSPQRAQQALEGYLERPYRNDLQILIESYPYCQTEGYAVAPDADLMLAPLAEALFKKGVYRVADSRTLPPGLVNSRDKVDLSREVAFARCIRQREPDGARALLETRPDSSTEREAAKQLLAVGGQCDGAGLADRAAEPALRSKLRSMIGIAAYLDGRNA